jgi:DNA-binding LacI/PurR family transcriptional regulator
MTITEIAKAAGVSTATVSRYLNKMHVKEETRKKLDSVILKMKYVPKSMAHQIVNTPSTSIAILTHSLTNNYSMEFAEIISQYYMQRRVLSYIVCTQTKTIEYQYLIDLVSHGVQGAILQDSSDFEAQIEIYNNISKYMPIVLVHSFDKEFPFNTITVNQKTGMQAAMHYLLDLGHRDIVFVRGKEGFSFDLKQQIWQEELKKRNIPANKNQVITVSDCDKKNGMQTSYKAVTAYFNEGNKPSAIFTCNDIMAMGTLRAIREQGWSVPRDISLVSHDNTALAECNGITSVDIKIKSVAIAAMDLLDYVLNGKDTTPRHISITPGLIKRSSVLPLSETQHN